MQASLDFALPSSHCFKLEKSLCGPRSSPTLLVEEPKKVYHDSPCVSDKAACDIYQLVTVSAWILENALH